MRRLASAQVQLLWRALAIESDPFRGAHASWPGETKGIRTASTRANGEDGKGVGLRGQPPRYPAEDFFKALQLPSLLRGSNTISDRRAPEQVVALGIT